MRLLVHVFSVQFLLSIGLPAFANCSVVTEGIASMQLEPIRLANDQGEVLALDVLVADDTFERASGFQHVCPEVIDETLILFRYPGEVQGRFHMQNVHAPLDIAFFDGKGNVVSVQLMETYSDERRPLYGPSGSFQYALEARQGFFSAKGVSPRASKLLLD